MKISMTQVAEIVGMHTSTLYAWDAENLIPVIEGVKGTFRFDDVVIRRRKREGHVERIAQERKHRSTLTQGIPEGMMTADMAAKEFHVSAYGIRKRLKPAQSVKSVRGIDTKLYQRDDIIAYVNMNQRKAPESANPLPFKVQTATNDEVVILLRGILGELRKLSRVTESLGKTTDNVWRSLVGTEQLAITQQEPRDEPITSA